MINLTVCKYPEKNSELTFTSLNDAISYIPADNSEPVTIDVLPGEYYEKVVIDKPFIHIKGTNADECIFTYDDFAFDTMPDGTKRGTFRSYSFMVDAKCVTLENISIVNSKIPRSVAGQAIALYADGENLNVISCKLMGYQDTLFTGPLPKKEIQPGGFIGPKEHAERIITHQYYKDCFISGDIDFIFGSAVAYFDKCEIKSVHAETLPLNEDGTTPVYGFATAASTYEGYKYGYVFENCRFTSDCPKQSVYLGRPWRDYAKTVLLNCFLDEHIRPEGFHDWDKPDARKNCFYAEYKSYGPGAACGTNKRDDFVKELSEEEAAGYSKETVLGIDFPFAV